MKLGLLVLAMILAISAAAGAQGMFSQDRLQVSPHYFYLTDGGARDAVGAGIGLNVSYNISNDFEQPLYLSLGYTAFSDSQTIDLGEYITSTDMDLSLIPLMITKYFTPQTNMGANKVYYGVGVGIVRTKLEITDDDGFSVPTSFSDSQTDFAWQLLAGMNFGKKAFGEIRYLNGGEDWNTGLALSIGARF